MDDPIKPKVSILSKYSVDETKRSAAVKTAMEWLAARDEVTRLQAEAPHSDRRQEAENLINLWVATGIRDRLARDVDAVVALMVQ
jgi:hypothetical protein